MAEAYLAQRTPRVEVAPAGTHALIDEPADDKAIAVARAQGLSLEQHRARQLEERIAREQDLILVMEKNQLEWVRNNLPFARATTFLLSHWRDGDNVDDPYRRGQYYFNTIYDRIQQCLDEWVARIQPARRA
ncbi:hypothetical protein [Salinisphaera sp. SPP-AMP-43]|uniref:arsenate reductase/protein-tyrosine-phosphatase family protein n=1 Tax=Salinisphaera sp. SPP-AMP-43 TaxID=3121288 RepID=UPI003C6E912A